MTVEAALREKSVDTQPAMKLAVTSAKAPDFVKGRRDFFKYRDLGVTKACEGQFVYTLKGWVELEFEDGTSCRLEAGDSVFIPGGLRHNEMRTSDNLEILEVSVPADMGTVSVDPPAGRPNGS